MGANGGPVSDRPVRYVRLSIPAASTRVAALFIAPCALLRPRAPGASRVSARRGVMGEKASQFGATRIEHNGEDERASLEGAVELRNRQQPE